MTTIILAVFAGGCLGAVARYTAHRAVHAHTGAHFPFATLLINVSGSFLLGLLLPALHAAASPAVTAFVTIGCLGAFTTFSTFAWDAASLLGQQRRAAAAAYMVLSPLSGLLAVGAGLVLGS